jgi:hypothetical protein
MASARRWLKGGNQYPTVAICRVSVASLSLKAPTLPTIPNEDDNIEGLLEVSISLPLMQTDWLGHLIGQIVMAGHHLGRTANY